MYGGKYIGLIFPRFNWGSHFVVNREAYKLLEKECNKNKRFKLKKTFPTLKQISFFEELNGPDGLWLEGKLSSSSMHYNPINGQGEAPQSIRKNFEILKKILRNKRRKINLPRAARRASFLAHLVADSLTPAHHFGRYSNIKVRYYWWLIKSDWKEDGISGLKKGVSLEYWHKKFEFKLFYKLVGNNFGPVKIHYDFIKEYQSKNESNQFLIQNNSIKQVEKIYESKIYRNFIKNKWNKEIETAMVQKVFPMIISWVATYWLLALLEAKDVKY